MLKGRLGIETGRIPQVDRHGLMWLGRGNLYVEDGTLHFATAGYDGLPPGNYALPFQMVSCVLAQPGTTISHDALRLLARHGTGLVAIGQGAVRFYASMPFGPDRSARARRQAELWTNADERVRIVRRMYAWRMGEVLPVADIDALRGIEGARVKKAYKELARQFGVAWKGRQYDRNNPEGDDLVNQSINHASSAVRAAAMVAVAVTGAIPQLGFIHEESGIAFALDIADLFREDTLLPIAFGAAREAAERPGEAVDRVVRRLAAETFRREKAVPRMIDRIKELLDADDGGSDA